MSSSVVIERTEEKKNDDTLVIIVNADGTLSVDPETLQKVLASQQNSPVSILQCVDSGQPVVDEENENGLKANLVVEGYFPQNNTVPVPATVAPVTTSAPNPVIGSVDEFMCGLGPTEAANLDSALQSEAAKRLLDPHLLDNLYVNDKGENKSMNVHSSIQFDHCYTSFYQPKKVSNANDVRQQQQIQAIPKGKNTIVVATKKSVKNSATISKNIVKQIVPTATQVPAVSSSGEFQLILSPSKQLQLGSITSQSSNFTIASPIQSSESHAVIKTSATIQKTDGRTLMRIVPDLKKQGPKFSKLSPGQELNVQNINLSVLSPSKVLQSPLKQQQVLDGENKGSKIKLNRQPVKFRKQDDKAPSAIIDKQRHLEVQLKRVSLSKGENSEGVAFVSSSGGPVEVKTSNPETKPATSGKKQAPKTVSSPLVVGPELFSAPDIIRRVSTEQNLTKPDDKNLDNSETMVPKLHDLNYNPDLITVSSDESLLHHSQNLQEELPVADSSTGFDLNNLPVVFASNQDVMISKPPQISKGPGGKSISLKQMTLSNSLKVISPKSGEKVFTSKTNQPSTNLVNQQGDLDMNNLLSQSFPLDSPLSRKKSLSHESPAARGTGRERKVNPKYDTAYTDGAELDLDTKAATPSPKKPAISKKQDRRRSNEKKNLGNRSGSDNLDGLEIAAALDDDLPSEDDQSWNSEDDPDRLWCICKKPHNNRFMICCDTCEEWFHGACVNITKAMGEEMEKQGIEWVCPQCKKKKLQDGKGLAGPKDIKKTPEQAEPKKITPKRKSIQEVHSTNSEDPSSKPVKSALPEPRITSKRCHVCQENTTTDGVFCSEKCIDTHVNSFLELEEKNEKGSSKKLDKHVMVVEKHSGRVIISNNMAPTIGNLRTWLHLHPTCHIVMPKDHPSTEIYNKQRKLAPIPKKTPQPVKEGSRIVTVTLASLPAGTSLGTVTTSTPASVTTPNLPKPGVPTTPTSKTAPSPVKQLSTQQTPKLASSTPQNAPKTQATPTQKTLKQQTLTITGTLKTITPNQAGKTPIAILSRGLNKTPPSAASTPVSNKISAKRPSVKEVKLEPKEKPKQVQKIDKRKSDPSSSKRVSEEAPTTPKTPDNEPIRAKCRQMLQDALMLRIRGCSDLQISEEEVSKLVQDIEEEHFVVYKDAAKYRTKIRSLVLNIKAPKNDTLYRKIATKTYNPQQVARLSQDEMASEELATWRQNENKHSLDMIKKNELDLLAMSKTCVLKTHKGEQEIENVENRKEVSAAEFVPDLNDSENIIEAKSSPKFASMKIDESKKSNEKEKESSKDKHRSSSRRHESSRHSSSSSSSSRHRRSKRHRSDRDKEKDKDKDKDKDKKSSDRKKDEKSSSSRESRSKSRSTRLSDSKSKDLTKIKSDDEATAKTSKDTKSTEESDIVKLQSDSLSTLMDTYDPAMPSDDLDIDPSDREPSSTVIINTPPYEEEQPPLWKGLLSMTDVAKFYATFQAVSGNCANLGEDVPSSIDCVGRINPATVWEYIGKVKKSGSKDIIVIRFTPENDEEQVAYLSLYAYLSNKNRMAVVGHLPAIIKDFYVLPLADHSPIPQVLLPLDGPGFEDVRPHLLLGIIVKHRIETLMPSDVTNFGLKEPRSYTPPPTAQLNTVSLTPPYPPPTDIPVVPAKKAKYDDSNIISPVLNEFHEDNSPYSPGEDEPYSPGDNDDDDDDDDPTTVQRKIADLTKGIEDKKKLLESMPQQTISEEIYSPSRPVSPEKPTLSFYNSTKISLPPNLQEILSRVSSYKQNKQSSSPGGSLTIGSDPIIKQYSKFPAPQEEKSDDKEGIEEIAAQPSSDEEYESMEEDNPESSVAPDTPKLNRDPRQRREMPPQPTDEEAIKDILGVSYPMEGLPDMMGVRVEDPTNQSVPQMMDMSVPPPMIPYSAPYAPPPFTPFPGPAYAPQPPFMAPVQMPMGSAMPAMVPAAPMMPAPMPFPPPAPPAPTITPNPPPPPAPPAPILSNPSDLPSSSTTEPRSLRNKLDRVSDSRQDREFRTRNKDNGNNKNSGSSSNYGNYRKDEHRPRDRYRRDNRDRFRPHGQFWRGRGSKSQFNQGNRHRDEFDADIEHFEKEQLRRQEERRKKAP